MLIVVTGAPAAGKTAPARHVAEETGLPPVCRDDVCEALTAARVRAAAKSGKLLARAALSGFFGAIERTPAAP